MPPPLTRILPSYLFLEYQNDPDLPAFITAQNDAATQMLTDMNALNLPIYPLLSGPLLDWAAQGIYNWTRPTLAGALVDDDVFQRCITWSNYKGDGRVFNIRWLKRRVQRFLDGANGTDPGVNQTYQISVRFGPPNIVYINVLSGVAIITGGALYNEMQFNQKQFNELDLDTKQYVNTGLILVLQEGINSGVLELPFQFQYVVGVNQ